MPKAVWGEPRIGLHQRSPIGMAIEVLPEGVPAGFRQHLDRHPYWQSPQAETNGLVPYSLRHRYAWRGANYYTRAVPVRDLASLMGNDVKTHQKHYGQWTTDEDTKE